MARVRWERLNHYRNQSTYQAIECENARAAMAALEKSAVSESRDSVERICDIRDPVEIARAANAALKGAA